MDEKQELDEIIELMKSGDMDKIADFLRDFNDKLVKLNEQIKQSIDGYEDEDDATTNIHIGRLDI